MHLEKDYEVWIERNVYNGSINISFLDRGNIDTNVGKIVDGKIEYSPVSEGSIINFAIMLSPNEFKALIDGIKDFNKEYDMSETTFKELVKIKDAHLQDMRTISMKLLKIDSVKN